MKYELSFSDGIVNRNDRILVSAVLHAKDPDYQLELRIMSKDSTLRRARICVKSATLSRLRPNGPWSKVGYIF